MLERAVDGRYTAAFLLVLLAGKTLATSLTMSIGGSGGVFAPSLFMGATLGSAYGQAAHALLPHATASAGAYGLVGMGAVFAASARAPMTAVLIIFELTHEYSTILPLMLAIVIATAISARLSPDTIYTLKLRRRGIDVTRRTQPLLADLQVRHAMSTPPDPVTPNAPLADLLERFSAGSETVLPVLDEQQSVRGVITAADLEAAMQDPSHATLTATQIAHTAPIVHPDDPLDDAIQALGRSESDGLPVTDADNEHIVGWITQRDILTIYRQRLDQNRNVDQPTRRRPSSGSSRLI